MSGGDRSWSGGGGTGGGGTGGGGGGTTEGSPCISFTRTVALNTPIPKVVRSLRVGQLLRLELAGGQSTGRIEARTENDDLAGAITFDGVSRLKQCLQEGYTYVAEVVQLPGGGVCMVAIRYERY